MLYKALHLNHETNLFKICFKIIANIAWVTLASFDKTTNHAAKLQRLNKKLEGTHILQKISI